MRYITFILALLMGSSVTSMASENCSDHYVYFGLSIDWETCLQEALSARETHLAKAILDEAHENSVDMLELIDSMHKWNSSNHKNLMFSGIGHFLNTEYHRYQKILEDNAPEPYDPVKEHNERYQNEGYYEDL